MKPQGAAGTGHSVGVELDEKTKKQFDFATDLVKQLITLSTGVLALTITFLHDILGNAEAPTSLLVAWVLYVSSIPLGIVAMMALTAELTAEKPSILSLFISIPASLQTLTFLAGTIAILVFGWGTY